MQLRTLIQPMSIAAYGALSILLLMIFFPEAALASALRGLGIWWEVLFPSLFPFFVISELLIGFGIVHFCGKLLDPFMRPLFRLPGSGGFVIAMGYLSGYPVGARLTAQLYEKQLVNRIEGERLVAFTTSSDPIFLIGAVSIGFFHNVAIAPLLAIAHYGGGLVIGVLMRWHGRKEEHTLQLLSLSSISDPSTPSRLTAALQAMHQARLKDGRNLGQLMNDAIASALRLMIVVGGLVVFFSVLMEMLSYANILPLLYSLLTALLSLTGLPSEMSAALGNGLFEVTLGAKAAGSSSIALIHQVAVAAWVLSWGGLSVHAQIASLLSQTHIRYIPLLLARLLHGFIAMAIIYIIWPYFH